MRYYIGVVHQDENSAYGIHFPDVPGCFSAADTLDELLPNAAEAVALHLEGERIPRARPLDVVRRLRDVQADLKNGAFLLAVPFIHLTGGMVRANITMDAGLLDAMDHAAEERGLTRSAFIADLARREMGIPAASQGYIIAEEDAPQPQKPRHLTMR